MRAGDWIALTIVLGIAAILGTTIAYFGIKRDGQRGFRWLGKWR